MFLEARHIHAWPPANNAKDACKMFCEKYYKQEFAALLRFYLERLRGAQLKNANPFRPQFAICYAQSLPIRAEQYRAVQNDNPTSCNLKYILGFQVLAYILETLCYCLLYIQCSAHNYHPAETSK